jgi:predicted dinucleotide-binding enzyme
VARVLIIGCGCRGRSLARQLSECGHAVRGTTRDPGRAADIEDIGAEAFVGDPDRVGTLAPALDGVGVVCLLLGSASGTPEAVAALHGSRLEMLLLRTIDTTVRGVVYEATGTVDPAVLSSGASIVREACEQSRIPCVVLAADPAAHDAWLEAALGAVDGLLAPAG